ncbi:MAG: ABC transporter permease [Lachnospiraceae bacterium]|nr:ABC transporter permease [Lachnospiraceae bacterium]
MRSIVFSKRTVKEILRDPLSYIFCLGFPIVMLIIMTIVDQSIPKEAGMEIFHINKLAPGIALFGLSFIMLFTCLQVSKDRSTAFILRLYASPMKSGDFIAGYTLPVLLLTVLQAMITFLTSVVIGNFVDYQFELINILVCILVLIPSALVFISFGIFFGTLLNDKAAPGICSIIITASSMLGGIWMDVDTIGGAFARFCHVLPFYQGVRSARLALEGSFGEMAKPALITFVYGIVIYIFAVFVLKRKMQQDIK